MADQPKRPDAEGLIVRLVEALTTAPTEDDLQSIRDAIKAIESGQDYIEALERDLVTASEIAWEGLEDLLSGCEANNGEPCDENLAPCVAHQYIRGIRRRYPYLFGEGE